MSWHIYLHVSIRDLAGADFCSVFEPSLIAHTKQDCLNYIPYTNCFRVENQDTPAAPCGVFIYSHNFLKDLSQFTVKENIYEVHWSLSNDSRQLKRPLL